MKRIDRMRLPLTSLLALLLAYAAQASAEPRAVLPYPDYDFGTVVRGAVVEHEFVLSNAGTEPLHIEKARMTTPLVPTQMPAAVAPGAEGPLRFKLDTADLEGPFSGQVLVDLNDPAEPEVALTFEGRVIPPIEVSPVPAFFVAAQRGERKEAALEIVNHEPEPLRIEKVEYPADRFTTSLETLEPGRRYRLSLILASDAALGRRRDIITLATSSAAMPVLRIPANTYLHERVYAFPDAVDLGTWHLGDVRRDPEQLPRAAQTLMVYQVGGSDFRIDATSDLPALEVEAARGPAGDRYQLTLTLLGERIDVGPLEGAVHIRTNDPGYPTLLIPLTGVVLRF